MKSALRFYRYYIADSFGQTSCYRDRDLIRNDGFEVKIGSRDNQIWIEVFGMDFLEATRRGLKARNPGLHSDESNAEYYGQLVGTCPIITVPQSLASKFEEIEKIIAEIRRNCTAEEPEDGEIWGNIDPPLLAMSIKLAHYLIHCSSKVAAQLSKKYIELEGDV